MKKQDYTPKEVSLKSGAIGTGNVQKEFFTADEAVAFMEPRIRAMFR